MEMLGQYRLQSQYTRGEAGNHCNRENPTKLGTIVKKAQQIDTSISLMRMFLNLTCMLDLHNVQTVQHLIFHLVVLWISLSINYFD